ncbi:hypothetical protein [Streptomyces sp. NBC_01500]|uniref:hypothetical protein n=1 Tax=Streptomyces sp. NBC_01500 TaxID=2903886 RepID=UPI00225C2A89|nr:hypothetical protein [Streptomyces sp. NBC_01500]MCX4554137.1 hypothetical protein [Streptomyces sp. NBC_01500]
MTLDETSEWGPEGYLLARISDALELSNYYFIQANTSEDQKEGIPAPEAFPRPGQPISEEETPKHEFASGHEVADFFNQMSNL